jgi:hypothetical protein
VDLLRVGRWRATRRLIFVVVRHIEALKSELLACSRACRRRRRFCLQVEQCLRRGTLEDDEQLSLRTPVMNEVHSLQRTNTAEDEGIAQGVTQCEKSIHGKKGKKSSCGQCRRSRVSGASSALRPNLLTFRLGRPSFRPASLDTVQAMPRYLLMPLKSLSVLRSTSGFKTHSDTSSLSA